MIGLQTVKYWSCAFADNDKDHPAAGEDFAKRVTVARCSACIFLLFVARVIAWQGSAIGA
jgi:hypothetical protein